MLALALTIYYHVSEAQLLLQKNSQVLLAHFLLSSTVPTYYLHVMCL